MEFPSPTSAASLTRASVRVVCRRFSAHGNYMCMHGLAVRTHESSLSLRSRPLGHRTQMMARGPGWRLADGEGGSWHIRLIASDDSVATWAHLLRTLRSIADSHGMRAATIDLRGAPRLCGAAADAATLLFAEFEQRGLRLAIVVGPDLIHAARVHRLLLADATTCGRCVLDEDEAIEWVARTTLQVPPPIAAPLRMVHGRSLELQPPRV